MACRRSRLERRAATPSTLRVNVSDLAQQLLSDTLVAFPRCRLQRDAALYIWGVNIGAFA